MLGDANPIELRLSVRRVFAEDPNDFGEMCGHHKARAQALHAMLSDVTVSDWGETDSNCSGESEPPIAVFVDVSLQDAADFVVIVRDAASSLKARRIGGFYIRAGDSLSLSQGNFGNSVVLEHLGAAFDVRVDGYNDGELREIFASRFQTIPGLED